jgi:hypothetical protein
MEKAGFRVAREEFTGTSFYFSKLIEAKRVCGGVVGAEAIS